LPWFWSLLFPSLLLLAIEQAGPARGPAMGTFTALADLGMGLGPMIMGSILQRTSYPVMFSCLVLTAVSSFLFYYFVVGKNQGRRGAL
jgi:predicted MFS family arabinose efflux permease